MIIKILLLAALAATAVKLVRGHRSALGLLMRRSVMLCALASAALAVLFPDRVTGLAEAVGVGRGTDLVVYMLCVAVLFVSITLYQRLRALEDRFVELTRRQGLMQAELDTNRLGEVLRD